jgi:hypothetical protein
MKKITSFIVFLCCFTAVLHAQLDTFNLSRYKLPDIKFRQLDLNVNLDGSHSFDNNKTEDNTSKYSKFESNNDVNIGYKSYRNSEHLQNEQEFSFGISPNFSNSISDGDFNYKISNFSSDIQFTSRNRIYNNNLFFFEPDIHIYGYVSGSKEDRKSSSILVKSGNVSSNIQVPLLVGHGRIEQVQDARLAVYIFGELQKAGRITKTPDTEEILEFSRLISKLKNERYFDYRIRKMEEIEKVDSFLQAKGLITKADARYFTVVNDNWDYAQGPVRESGKRLSAGLEPDLSYTSINAETTSTIPDYPSERKYNRVNMELRMQVLALYEIEKPTNLHWQKSMSVKVSYGYSKSLQTVHPEEAGTSTDADLLQLNAGMKYGMGYFPNSRTDITGQVSLDFQQWNRKENLEEPLEKGNGYGLAPKFTLAAHYYISPQCRLHINYSISYYYTDSNIKFDYDTEYNYIKTNYLTQSFSVGFLYSFF